MTAQDDFFFFFFHLKTWLHKFTIISKIMQMYYSHAYDSHDSSYPSQSFI